MDFCGQPVYLAVSNHRRKKCNYEFTKLSFCFFSHSILLYLMSDGYQKESSDLYLLQKNSENNILLKKQYIFKLLLN